MAGANVIPSGSHVMGTDGSHTAVGEHDRQPGFPHAIPVLAALHPHPILFYHVVRAVLTQVSVAVQT